MRSIRLNLYEIIFASLIFGLFVIKLSFWYFTDNSIYTYINPKINDSFFDNIYIQLILRAIVFYFTYIILNVYGFVNFTLKELLRTSLLLLLCYSFICLSYLIPKINYSFQSVFYKQVVTNQIAPRFASQTAISFLLILFLYFIIKSVLLANIGKKSSIGLYYPALMNSISFTFFAYLFILYLLFVSEQTLNSDGASILFIFFIPPTIISVFINVFKFFPDFKNKPRLVFIRNVLTVPLLFTFFTGMIYLLIAKRLNYSYLFIHFAFQVIFSIPISSLIYVQLKAKFGEVLFLKNELARVSTDLQSLKSQINPHFLFNTLNMIYGNALNENAPNTADSIQRLGDMMRYMIYENNSDFIPLSLELLYIENYISLQKNRLEINKKCFLKLDMPVDNVGHSIAPMLLLPFVENAFKHGNKDGGEFWIDIKLLYTDTGIDFTIKNSLNVKETEKETNKTNSQSSGIGIKNVRDRLDILYQQKHTLTIHKGMKEFSVQLKIDLK